MSDLAVSVQHIGFKYYGQNSWLFTDLSLQIFKGERFGLFGPNGAGKTTLMNLMTGLLPYKKGRIQLLTQDVKRHDKSFNKVFGLVPQDFSFYQELSPIQNLEFFGAWYGLSYRQTHTKAIELLSVLGLTSVKDKPVRKFSGGMKRRINLAIAVMHEPEILFLDEPTVGVDVQTRQAIIEYLLELNRRGTTLIYTSHQLNEAEDLCKQIALIDEGKIVANDSLEQLLLEHQQDGLEGLFLSQTGKAYRD